MGNSLFSLVPLVSRVCSLFLFHGGGENTKNSAGEFLGTRVPLPWNAVLKEVQTSIYRQMENIRGQGAFLFLVRGRPERPALQI